MAKEIVNPITGHQISWMHSEFGWISLLNGAQFAGTVYFVADSQPLIAPHVDSDNSIVLSIHIAHLDLMLGILRNEQPLQVRFFDPEVPGGEVSAFIESVRHLLDSQRALAHFQ